MQTSPDVPSGDTVRRLLVLCAVGLPAWLAVGWKTATFGMAFIVFLIGLFYKADPL